MIILISLFIASSIIIESLGVWLRYIGAVNSESSLGYSSHVRFATLGRFFILFSAPLLGFLIDSGIKSNDVAIIGVLVFSIVFIVLLLSFNARLIGFLKKIYCLLNKRDLVGGRITPDFSLSFFKKNNNKKLVFSSCISFLMTASGILIVNYFATVFVENRAMIVQMSAFVTMLGTLTHAFYVDPILARCCDENADLAFGSIINFIMGRIISSVLLIIFFSTLVLL